MSTLFTLVHLAALICFIVFLVKMIKKKKAGEDNSQAKKFMLISLAVWFVSFIIVGVTAPETEDKKEDTETVAEETEPVVEVETVETEPEASSLEVQVDVSGRKEGNAIAFDINTNLPDETELMLTLSKGDYNTDDAFRAQTKVTIKDGKASSDPFSAKGEPLTGDYDLSISMSLPSLQSDAVRAVIGEEGEKMSGPLVENSGFGSSNVVSAMFTVATDGDVEVSASTDYKYTIFAEENEEAQDGGEEIEIEAGVTGEYGQELVLNAGTEFEDKTIGYFVPAGKYEVTNIGEHMTQVNVYKNEKNVVDGWEEWADGHVELIDVNATKEMTVEEGYFFNVDAPAHITVKKVD